MGEFVDHSPRFEPGDKRTWPILSPDVVVTSQTEYPEDFADRLAEDELVGSELDQLDDRAII